MMSSPRLVFLPLLLLLFLSSTNHQHHHQFLFSSSFTSAQSDGLDNRDAWPPISPRINATVSPFLVWTFDWTVVGCSFLACFGGLSNGPMAALTIQRFRALRQPIAQQCTWKAQYNAIISTGNNTSILDRADTPSGFAIEVDGGRAERFIVGAFWFNLIIAVGVVLIQFAVAHILERYLVKKEEVAGAAAPPSEVPATTTTTKKLSSTSYEMTGKKQQFLYVATKWGFGRVLTGVVVLPLYSAFRLAMIIVATGDSASSVIMQARIAVGVHLLLIAAWMFVAPSMASRRCFTQDRINETKTKQRNSFLAWLLEDRVRWRFEKMDDFKAMVVVASVENVNKETRWWVVPLELFVTIAIDLGPLATTNPDDPSNACFVNNLTGLILTTLLWWFVLYLRPFQRRIQHMCWFIQLSMQNFSYLFGVLQEQQTAPVPKKREIFIVLCFITCFTSILVTCLFTFLPVIRKIVDKALAAKAQGVGLKKFLSFANWEQEFLSMLQQDQAVRSSLNAGKNKNDTSGGGGGDGLDEELLLAIHGLTNGSGGENGITVNHADAIAHGQERDTALDDELAKFLNDGNNFTTSLALPSAEYSPASVAELRKQRNQNNNQNSNNNKPSAISTTAAVLMSQEDGDFLSDFLGKPKENPQLYPQPNNSTTSTNNNQNDNSTNYDTSRSTTIAAPPPPPPPSSMIKPTQSLKNVIVKKKADEDYSNKDPLSGAIVASNASAPAVSSADVPEGEEGEPDEQGYYYDEQGNPYYYEYEQEDGDDQQNKPNLDWL